MVLSSRSSQTVQFWFDFPEPFPNPKPIVDFDFNYDDVKVSSSGFALLISTCSSLYASWTVMILHQLLTLMDLLGYRCSGMFGFAPCIKRGADNEIDVSDITFFNDPDDEVPLPQVPPSAQPSSSTTSTKDAFSILLKAGHTPATVTAGSWCSGQPMDICQQQ
ncbi:uncharacterized protein F5891DRAFT_1197531 [Suillus fuscotomentosus]|uniref:Uncharacterized protein n=1 Tax=Suillus fuscotomentosus TaxID=1912939 RepID=A0AAD4DTJ1_9AGAM|nr:uncharacterized protein F5891DRAFT_1197531 [Suillus fuscotomentosus]KAG1891693.1 hypothetical protein F5891DRAFT_1197531 [Suillus fuscotomentosus]